MRTAGKAGGSAPEAITWRTVERHVAAVEIAHLARAHLGGADGETRRAIGDQREIDEFVERRLQRRGRIVAGGVGRERHVPAQEGERIGLEEAGDPGGERVPVGQARADPRQPGDGLERRRMLDAPPELAQLGEPVLRLVAGDDGGVDRADRRSDQPVGLDAGLVQRLVDAGLVGAERPAALEDEDDLTKPRLQILASAC